MIKPNINTAGRIMRATVAVLIFAYAVWAGSLIALLISLFVFFEAAMSWCVVYQLLGWNSCSIKNKK